MPIIRGFISLVIFRPIWAFIIKKRIINSQNKDYELECEEKGKKYKPRRKIHKNWLSRLLGGLFGGVEGLIAAFIVLIPITVMASYVSDIDTAALASIESDTTSLSSGSIAGFSIPDEIIDYLNQIKEMDENGFGAVTRQITINQVPIDQYIFDQVFTVKTTVNDEDVSVNFINELENIIGIGTILINGGYLDPDFDFTQISTADLENIEALMTYIGNSDMLQYLIPTAAQYGVDQYLSSESGIDFSDRQASQDALDMFYNIDWSSEFGRLYTLIASVLEFGSVQEILDYMSDPTSLADLTPEQGIAMAEIIRSFGDLEVLSLINVGIDYLTTLESVQNQISWISDQAEKEEYLQEQLAFILDDPDFFIGENGEINEIANLIALFFDDSYGDTNLDQIIDSNGDIQTILTVQNEDWVSALITQLTQLDLLMNAIPVGVDFALYNMGGELIDETLAADLETSLATVTWDDEFTNFDNIYQSIVKIGLEQILVDNPNYYQYLDFVIENNIDDVKDIVTYIFEDSQIVNLALTKIAPTLIDQFITDAELKEIVESIVLDDQDEFVFEVGSEINNLLTIAESAYNFTDITELQGFSQMTVEDQLQLLAQFGDMETDDYDAFISAFNELQILQGIDQDVALNIVNKFGFEDQVYLPSEFVLNDEFTAILDMVHDVGIYLNDHYEIGDNYEDLDLTDLLSVLSDDLLESDQRSDLVFFNMAYYAQKNAADGAFSSFLSVPDSLLNADIESQAWSDEITALIGSIFDIATVVGETDGITLSAHDIILYSTQMSDLPVELITQFSDQTIAEAAFGSLDDSLILRASIKKAIDAQGKNLSGSLFGHEIQTPAHLVTDDALNEGVFVDLINGFATFVDGMNETLGFTKFGNFVFDDLSIYFNAYNQMDNADIEAFVESDLLRGVISDILLDSSYQQSLVDTLNDAQDILDFPNDFFAVDDDLIDGPVLVSGEITNIFTMAKALELNDISDFSSIGLATFTDLVVEDPITGEDQFDEFFASNYIYTILDKIIQLDSISEYVSTLLGDSLGADFQTLDLSIPNAMLGQAVDVGTTITAIEEDRIPKEEFRNILTSISMLGDIGSTNLETFTNMIDPSVSNDDFATFINSDFIYFVLGRLIGNEGFSDYAEDTLSTAFGDDPVALDMDVPADALGTLGIEDGLITRVELRNLMVSFKLLGFGGDTEIDVASIISLPTLNTYSSTEDDLDIFLNSIYLRDKMSQMLLSDTIVDLIGSGQFEHDAFDLPLNAYDTTINTRLSQTQIHKLFDSLTILGISDFDSLDIGIETVTDLDSADQTELLTSIYLYEVIDLMIKAQEVDPMDPGSTGLTIPVDAYVLGGYYDGMVSETEILAVLSVFDIPEIGTDPTLIDMDDITTTVLMSVVDKGSVIINQMISDQIEDALTIDNTIVPEAYELTVGVDRILVTEMKAMVTSMEALSVTKLSEGVSTDNVSIATLTTLNEIGLAEATPVDIYDSYIVHYLISNSIKEALSSQMNIPTGSYMVGSTTYFDVSEIEDLIDALTLLKTGDTSALITSIAPVDNSLFTPSLVEDLLDLDSLMIYRLVASGIIDANLAVEASYAENGELNYDSNAVNEDLSIDEMYALVEAMNVMLITNINEPFDPNTITVAQLQDLHYVGLGDDGISDPFDSYIIHHMISDAIKTTLTNQPSTIYMTNTDEDILSDEVQAIISAILILNDQNTTETLADISFANTGLTPDKIEDLLDLNSVLVDRQISTGIIDASLAVDASYAIDGEFNYDETAINEDLKVDEMYALVEAMNVMIITNLDASFDPNTITIAQLQDLHYVGLGDDGISDPYDSTIVHHMISDAIETALTNRPSNIYMTNLEEDILTDEVQAVIDAIAILNTNPTATLGSMSFANSGLTPSKIEDLLDLDALIIYRQISEGIISANIDVTEAYAIVGEDNYDSAYLVPGNLNIDEMYAIVAAMDVMTITDLDAPFDATEIDINDLQLLHYIGLGDDGISDPYDSYMVHNIISDGLNSSLPSIGDIAFSGSYIKQAEIQGFIDDLSTLGINSIDEFSSINGANVLTYFSDDAAVTTVFDNSSTNSLTITYYFLDDVLDPGDSTLPGVTRIPDDGYGVTLVVRDDLRDFIINNN
ncbi:MAG: hypothetical protein WCR19_04650 [Acholeplasmataceae bacterium]